MAQHKVIRFILNLKPMTRISYCILSEIKMLKVEDRAKQLRLNHVYSLTFYYNAILDWNSLPDDIKSITNKSYKTAVKRHLLTAGQSREAVIYYYF